LGSQPSVSLARDVSARRRWGSSTGMSLWMRLTRLARGLPSSFWTFSTMS
jgi:carbohydrate-binding DOMON domain-containing protein